VCVCVQNCVLSINLKRGGLGHSWKVAPQKESSYIMIVAHIRLRLNALYFMITCDCRFTASYQPDGNCATRKHTLSWTESLIS